MNFHQQRELPSTEVLNAADQTMNSASEIQCRLGRLLGTIAIYIIAVASCNTPATPQRLAFKSGVRSILQDSKGNLLIGNNSIGVMRYSTRRSRPSPIGPMKHVFAIAEDADGNIWSIYRLL